MTAFDDVMIININKKKIKPRYDKYGIILPPLTPADFDANYPSGKLNSGSYIDQIKIIAPKQAQPPISDIEMASKPYIIKELKIVIATAKRDIKPSIHLQALRMIIEIEGIEKKKDTTNKPLTEPELREFIRKKQKKDESTPRGGANEKVKNVYEAPREKSATGVIFDELDNF